ncbi:hypothetical protein [Thalassobellus suaedae]|uniref:Uncharacterized protein n=1 Tax=Thalassobellus suaedae TaxID=3074124 RepID=A0ABY9XWE1_9FLAO|nr:hypothetical protein RHP51_05055 [Flavobacteriaceae bacterium HL-DH14]
MNKETTKKTPIKEILETFVKNKNGVIFQVLQHKTKKDYVMLRLKNKYIEKRFVEVRQGIINGTLERDKRTRI